MTQLWKEEGFLTDDGNSVELADFCTATTERAVPLIDFRYKQSHLFFVVERWLQVEVGIWGFDITIEE